MTINPYIFFDGNCRTAFEFYSEILGVEPAMMVTVGESPTEDQMPGLTKDSIMHARLDIGGTHLMASDAPMGRYEKPQGFSLCLVVSSIEEGERVFEALSTGGQVYMPYAQTFWATRFGMLEDKFGIDWMINTEDAVP